jgi:hypothetical protein
MLDVVLGLMMMIDVEEKRMNIIEKVKLLVVWKYWLNKFYF